MGIAEGNHDRVEAKATSYELVETVFGGVLPDETFINTEIEKVKEVPEIAGRCLGAEDLIQRIYSEGHITREQAVGLIAGIRMMSILERLDSRAPDSLPL